MSTLGVNEIPTTGTTMGVGASGNAPLSDKGAEARDSMNEVIDTKQGPLKVNPDGTGNLNGRMLTREQVAKIKAATGR